MGRTNTNVAEHMCSKCRNRRPIHDFPHAEVVWWCRLCWRSFRVSQNEARRHRRQAALEQYILRPRSRGWSAQPYRSKGIMDKLSPWEQSLVWAEYSRLIAMCKGESRPLIQNKLASMKGNAVFTVLYARTGKVRAWTGNYHKRFKHWERLQEQRRTEQFRAKPIWQRHKYLDIS